MTDALPAFEGEEALIVTGISGRLGRRLTRLLHRQGRVIGIDRRPFPDRPSDVEHHELDLRSGRVRDVFRRAPVRAVVHLGVLHDPRKSAQDNLAYNVLSWRRLSEWVEQVGVSKLVVLSSANVYGPRPENPHFLSEEAPLLAAGRFSDIRDLVELDLASQSFFWRRPETETVILRPAHILGTVTNAPSNYFRLAHPPTLLGFDPMIQVVHQDDVVRAIVLALKPGIRGIFNLAGPPPVALSRALQLLGRRALPVPHGLARAAVDQLFRWHMTSFPAPELDFIRYVCMVDDTRARSILGYESRHDLTQTLSSVDDERWVD